MHRTALLFLVSALLIATAVSAAPGPSWNRTLDERILSLDISSDGNSVVVGTDTGYVRVFDRRGNEVWSARLPGEELVKMTPDGSRVVVGSRENPESDKGTIRVFDRDGKEIFMANTGWMVGVGISPDGGRIAAGTRTGRVYLFGPEGSSGNEATAGTSWFRRNFVMSPDGRYAGFSLSAGEPHFSVYGIGDNSEKFYDAFGDCFAFRPGSEYYAAGGGEGDSGSFGLYTWSGGQVWSKKTGRVTDLAVTDASSTFTELAVGTASGIVALFDLNGNEIWNRSVGGEVRAIRMAGNLSRIAVGSSDGYIHVYDPNGAGLLEYNTGGVIPDDVRILGMATRTGAFAAVSSDRDLYYFEPVAAPVITEVPQTPVTTATAPPVTTIIDPVPTPAGQPAGIFDFFLVQAKAFLRFLTGAPE